MAEVRGSSPLSSIGAEPRSDAGSDDTDSLAAEIPAPVLADLIGIADKTATKWAALAARDWSAYIAQREG